MKRKLATACAALIACLTVTGAAQSAPLSSVLTGVKSGMSNGVMQNVHYRETRHCHWRDGKRRCRGGASYYDYDGYDGAGIVLNLGGRNRHHRNWNHNNHLGNEGLSYRHHYRRVFLCKHPAKTAGSGCFGGGGV